jgi:hypothetical protein
VERKGESAVRGGAGKQRSWQYSGLVVRLGHSRGLPARLSCSAFSETQWCTVYLSMLLPTREALAQEHDIAVEHHGNHWISSYSGMFLPKTKSKFIFF